MKLAELLFSSDIPAWIKIGVVLALLGMAAAWWTRDYWQDLHTPDTPPGKNKYKPPF